MIRSGEGEPLNRASSQVFWCRDSQRDALAQPPDLTATRNMPATKIDMEMLTQDVKNYPVAYQYEPDKQLGVSACVIVMDNPTFPKRQDVKTTFAHPGHTLEYLPSYSPDFNAI